MMYRRLFLSAFFALSLAFVGARGASAADDAAGFISELSGKAIQVLGNKQLSQQDREQQFRTFMTTDFDIPEITQFVLGRYSNSASEQEKQDFAKLFQEYILRTYTNRFAQYSGEAVKVTGQKPDGATTVVQSQITRPNGAPPVKVDWIVGKKGSDFRITDVNVEGVSMRLSQRQEFAAIIQRNNGSVAALNQMLKEKIGG